MGQKLLIGSDSEMFARRGSVITSVAGALGCTKQQKRELCQGARLQEDNVLAEFDIDPFDNREGFESTIANALSATNSILNSMGLDIAEGVSSHIFTPQELASFHERAMEFGCEPDYNGIYGTQNEFSPNVDPGLRSAGAHVHFGFTDDVEVSAEKQMFLTIMCDMYMGLTSVVLDSDTRRRELYGKAGSIRYKEYGMEYRTLSNFWLFEKANRELIFDQATKAYTRLQEGSFHELIAQLNPEEVQRVINEGDKAMAEQYIKQFKLA